MGDAIVGLERADKTEIECGESRPYRALTNVLAIFDSGLRKASAPSCRISPRQRQYRSVISRFWGKPSRERGRTSASSLRVQASGLRRQSSRGERAEQG